MKNLYLLLIVVIVFSGCKNNQEEDSASQEREIKNITYQSYGYKIDDANVTSEMEIAAKYNTLPPGDTIDVKFVAKVNSVCQNKGCWIRLKVGEDEALVKFKDYGFFMPKDIGGDTVIVAGRAFVEEMSVDEQRHYAEDAGKTKDEVEAITVPKRTLSFVSNGVLIAENQ